MAVSFGTGLDGKPTSQPTFTPPNPNGNPNSTPQQVGQVINGTFVPGQTQNGQFVPGQLQNGNFTPGTYDPMGNFTPTPTNTGGGNTPAPTTGGGGNPQPQGPTEWNRVPNNVNEYLQFLEPNYTAGLFNLAGVAGNIGSMVGQTTPQATQFLGGLFSPTLNPMEQAFMQAGGEEQRRAMEQAMLRMEGGFENMPYHSGLQQVQREVLRDANNSMLREASQLGLQRQQLATGALQYPLEMPINAANTAAQAAERMFNMGNAAYNAQYQIPLSIFSQLPYAAPTVLQTQGQQGGKGLF